jgi:hypothetical protein
MRVYGMYRVQGGGGVSADFASVGCGVALHLGLLGTIYRQRTMPTHKYVLMVNVVTYDIL